MQLVELLAAEGSQLPVSTMYRILLHNGISRLLGMGMGMGKEYQHEPKVDNEWDRAGNWSTSNAKVIGFLIYGGGWHHVRGQTHHMDSSRAKNADAHTGHRFPAL